MRRIVILAFLIVIGAFGCRSQARPLKPIRPTPTAGGVVVSAQPLPVTFEEINANPAAYINQPIRVSGAFTPLERVTCSPYKGPLTEWALVGNGLQMNAVGYERVIPLLASGQGMTVDGVWRFYRGPVGCGKEPATANLWYLEVTRILQPNPIVQGGTLAELPDGQPQPTLPSTGGSTDDGFPLSTPPLPTEQSPLDLPPTPEPTEDPFFDGGAGYPPDDPADLVTPAQPTDDDPFLEPDETLIPPTPTPSPTPTLRVTPGEEDDEEQDQPQATPTATPTGTLTPTATPAGTPTLGSGTTTAATATPSVTPTGSVTATSESGGLTTATPPTGGQPLPTNTPTIDAYPSPTGYPSPSPES